MPRLLPLLLLCTPALAAEGQDLSGMAKAFGWDAVAAVVRAVANDDLSLSDAHSQLKALGLDRLSVPVRAVDVPGLPPGDDALTLTGCGWNDGVTCRLDLPPGAPASGWQAVCYHGKTALDVPLTFVVDPVPSAERPGAAHVGDLQACWSQAADRVVLQAVARPPLAEPRIDGIDRSALSQALAPHLAALSACAGREPAVLDLTLAPDQPAVVVLRRGQAEDVQATACGRKALAGVEWPVVTGVGTALMPVAGE